MKHSWHKKHFSNAFKIIRSRPLYFVFAPIAGLAGFGALLDAVIYFSNISATAVGLPGISSYLPQSETLANSLFLSQYLPFEQRIVVIITVLVALFFAVLAQSAVIYSSYNSGGRKKSSWKLARNGGYRILQSLSVNITGLVFVASSSYATVLLIRAIPGSSSIYIWFPLLAFNGLFLLYILTAKMIALQLTIGARVPVVDSIRDAVSMTSKSPILIFEHNVILFVFNIIIAIVLVILGKIVSTPILILGLWLSDLFNSPLFISVIANILESVILLIIVGVLVAFNFSSWAQLTKSLEKHPLTMALRHVFNRYRP